VLFARWTGSSGRVIAFEPAPASIEGLREQVRLNGVEDRVEIVGAAVSDAVGTASFASDGTSGANAIVHGASRRSSGAVVVRTTTIDAVCEERGLRPDVVKIDVEGAELEALRGARRTLASPGVQAFVEFHPAVWRERGITPAQIEAELDAAGLAAEPLAPSIDIWTTEGISVRLRRR
jgi:FkbM family methyltransferase